MKNFITFMGLLSLSLSAFALGEGKISLKATDNKTCFISYFSKSANPLLIGWAKEKVQAIDSKEECKSAASSVLGETQLRNKRIPVIQGTAKVTSVKYEWIDAGETSSGEFELEK